MNEEPALLKVLCLPCGNVWNAFCPDGFDKDELFECPECHQKQGVVQEVEESK